MQLYFPSQSFSVAPGVACIQQVGPANAPVTVTGLSVYTFDEGSQAEFTLAGREVAIVALSGRIMVQTGDDTFRDVGTRTSVFARIPTDSVYVTTGQPFTITAQTVAKVAIATAKTTVAHPSVFLPADIQAIEHRGKYNNKRLVHNILPDTLPAAERLLVVEVYTDSANWSSYPPHRHERDDPPRESQLEELYYHELDPANGFVLQRVYTDDRTLDEAMAVAHQGAVAVPRGYHPVGVPDGIDSYYLNAMAGSRRVWQFVDDPDFAWLRKRR
ncbi:5-deoxy-glucuronate isomerase [Lacticaseibacillus sp. GG6-2]